MSNLNFNPLIIKFINFSNLFYLKNHFIMFLFNFILFKILNFLIIFFLFSLIIDFPIVFYLFNSIINFLYKVNFISINLKLFFDYHYKIIKIF